MTTRATPDEQRIPSLLVSDLAIVGLLGDVDIDGFGGINKVDARVLKGDTPDGKAQRFELINHVKAGKHLELSITAQTYAQTKKPNRRYLRFADDHLAAAAATWKGQPYLVDHNTWSMKSAMGTLLSSKAVDIDGGTAFEQKIHAVKADAVLGILDGTFNKFSVGWWPLGPVLCSVHGTDIMKLDGCNCWPGDKVKLDDGRERVVEFIFTKVGGKETSSVVIPAVQDTHVDEIKAALAAELGIHHRISNRTTIPVTRPKETKMLFPRLAAALSLGALSESDDDRALAAVEALRQRAVTAETTLAATRLSLAQAEEAVNTLTRAQVGVQIDTALREHGYAAGKLRHSRDAAGKIIASPMETFLRDLGAKAGVKVLETQLGQMPVIVPVGQRPQSELVRSPDPTVLGEDDVRPITADNPYLRNAAEQTGQKIEDLVSFANGHVAGGAS